MTGHVRDDLELYALGALAAAEHERVAAHLAGCEACRADAEAYAGVADALAGSLPERDLPEGLRERILASARRDTVRERRRRAWRPTVPFVASGLLAAAVMVLVVMNVQAAATRQAMEAELAATREIALRVAQGGRTWSMQGTDPYRDARAMLYAPATAPAFVVFRDLPEPPAGYSYTVWLIDEEGRWVRGTSFDRVSRVQMVDVGVPIAGFEQCAVTLETRREGKRQGPVVMQSRIYQGGGR
ncbi:MAG TPA: anti-sigma factor [Candidatus Limnocylindria bacterium]|nr:anti-sigma factor [Candidatus Limnocylindria bacterium]